MADKDKKERSQLWLLKNAFNTDVEFTQKEMGTNVHWIRQILGLILGVAAGLLPLTGIVGLAVFFVVNAGFTTIYYSKFLEVEDSDVKWELFQEGFVASFATYLVYMDGIQQQQQQQQQRGSIGQHQQQQQQQHIYSRDIDQDDNNSGGSGSSTNMLKRKSFHLSPSPMTAVASSNSNEQQQQQSGSGTTTTTTTTNVSMTRSKDTQFKVPQERRPTPQKENQNTGRTSNNGNKEQQQQQQQHQVSPTNNNNNTATISQQLDIMKSLEFKRDIVYLNNQLKEQHEHLKKISFNFSIMQTRLKNQLNSSTLSEIKTVHSNLQQICQSRYSNDQRNNNN
ncbi:hypothetical protein DFA_01505 [Cavenderia fasciculata]|uniref:Uncharacterized protein n=1 Tax=Cavenderia fasciculata TaxID=261658 RepID=F4PT43_CACFS|nr:uncharacterized protein DFA_01505 [Cavenderia fasciculata]EGG21619.1 hypothetical protein DFA_01505 [Cavenderia fasciculata]|eukprot:XP_004359469.1 hypothetical protein DFA_01505 [Cavenderia fasciculata]